MMLMALGPFRVSLALAALESLNDTERARIEQMQRAQAMPTPQFLGPGDRTASVRPVERRQQPGGDKGGDHVLFLNRPDQ